MGLQLFKQRGVTDQYLSSQLAPGYSATVSPAVPPVYQQVDLQPDDGDLDDLQAAMDGEGWDYVGPGPAPQARTIKQIQPSTLGVDSNSIPVASGFTDIGLSVDVTTKGDTTLGIVNSTLLGVTIGGATRVLINGGSFNNVVIGPAEVDAPVLSGSVFAGCTSTINVPSTSNDTTYTIRVQAKAVGALASVIARAGSSLTCFEYA
jgi:hypothetical protein